MSPAEAYARIKGAAQLSHFVASFASILSARSTGQPPAFSPLLTDTSFAGLAVVEDFSVSHLLSAAVPRKNVTKLPAWVTPLSALSLLGRGQAPVDLDYLHIDLGNYDCAIMSTLLKSGYKPKLIQIAVNPEYPIPVVFGVKYSPDAVAAFAAHSRDGEGLFRGCSVALSAGIAGAWGYQAVAAAAPGDAVYARADLVPRFGPLALPDLQAAIEKCLPAEASKSAVRRRASPTPGPTAATIDALRRPVHDACVRAAGTPASAPSPASAPLTSTLAQADAAGAQHCSLPYTLSLDP